ncbi:SDR family NAD(P)-dependent oxidoreductase [Dactylosporangium sp. McL0621]|uniref:SDR family NAD(P)-dependent oxidoreductase n=1 Tax=Dactylosporangium sp. McL0621 TaxID=3415678 RepID=UPI003CEABDC8
MSRLAGRVALVTGGSRGIGAAVARRLANDGAAVALTYAANADKAEAVAEKIRAEGGHVLVLRADHESPSDPVAAVETVADTFGRLDILVNNAGIYLGGPLGTVPPADVDRILAVNVRAVFLASQAAAEHMTEGGRIVTIGSALSDRVPAEGMTVYAMAKSALVGLTRGLARDLGSRGITATLVHAGLIDTDMNPADGPASSFFSSVPALARYGEPDDVAAMVSYLCGDGARYVTGTALTVDGGFAA